MEPERTDIFSARNSDKHGKFKCTICSIRLKIFRVIKIQKIENGGSERIDYAKNNILKSEKMNRLINFV